MTSGAQRITIAEACPSLFEVRDGDVFYINDIIAVDPLNDLNAMHEAEKVLIFKDVKLYLKFATEIEMVVGGNIDALFATAAQRAEAFLRTLGLWV